MKCAQQHCAFPVRLYAGIPPAISKKDMDTRLENGSRKALCRASLGVLLPLDVVHEQIAVEIG